MEIKWSTPKYGIHRRLIMDMVGGYGMGRQYKSGNLKIVMEIEGGDANFLAMV